MLSAIYFSLHFAVIILGCIIAIHFDMTLGLLIAGTFIVKWWFMFSELKTRSNRLDESFKRNKQMEFDFDK
jgi:hypothetical protein|tara:strand:- start:1049 stop:1261 length:213 start_codon:yes stop_codon:yes gene_type:complete